MFEREPNPDWEYKDIWCLFQKTARILQVIEELLLAVFNQEPNLMINGLIAVEIKNLIKLFKNYRGSLEEPVD